MGLRTCIKYEDFDFELLDTNGLKEHSTSFSYNGKGAFVMMKGSFYPLRYYDNNGEVRLRMNTCIDDDSKLEFFCRLNDRIKQLIGYDYDIINNKTSMVELNSGKKLNAVFAFWLIP